MGPDGDAVLHGRDLMLDVVGIRAGVRFAVQAQVLDVVRQGNDELILSHHSATKPLPVTPVHTKNEL